MRHLKKGRKLGTDAIAHARRCCGVLRSPCFTNERIKTTETAGQGGPPLVDKVITWGKKGDVHSRRLAIAALGDKELVPQDLRTTSRRALRGSRRWLHPHPQARSAQGRRRTDGDHGARRLDDRIAGGGTLRRFTMGGPRRLGRPSSCVRWPMEVAEDDPSSSE